MTTPNNADPISLYLIPTSKQWIYELTEIELINADFNPAFLYEVNSLYKHDNADSYLVIPSTL